MSQEILHGFHKILQLSFDVRHSWKHYWHDGQPLEFVLPDEVKQAVATASYISVVALFDDALETYIAGRYPSDFPRRLVNRLEFLGARGEFRNHATLMVVKDRRDQLAHDANAFAGWDELYEAIRAMAVEPDHLKIVSIVDFAGGWSHVPPEFKPFGL